VTGEEREDDSSFAELEKTVGPKAKRLKKDEDQEMGWEF